VKADVSRILRRLKPEQKTGTLIRRPDDELAFVEDAESVGPPLLLDTCVYLDTLEGALPEPAEILLLTRRIHHLTLVVGELSHHFGRLNPAHPGTRKVLDELAGVIEDIPLHRMDTDISAGVSLEAGVLAGLLFRLGQRQKGQEVAALIDATVFSHALARGYTVLTGNIGDFDFLNQLSPAGRVLFYHAA